MSLLKMMVPPLFDSNDQERLDDVIQSTQKWLFHCVERLISHRHGLFSSENGKAFSEL